MRTDGARLRELYLTPARRRDDLHIIETQWQSQRNPAFVRARGILPELHST